MPLTAASTAAEQQLVMVEGILNGAVISRRTSSVFIPAAITLPAYDEDGNLTNDGRWIYTWDAENRFVQMDTTPQAVAAGAASQKLEFAYDHRSRRISKKVSEDLNGTGRLTQWRKFLYDGWNMIAELDALSDHAIMRTYAWGIDLGGSVDGQGGAGGVGGLLAVKHHGRSSTKTWSALNDANGNISGWWDVSTQTLTAQMEYDPFGNLIHDSTPEGLEISSVGFSSKLRDRETGLLYYGYRYYSPELGRWLSRDPIGERGGINLYGMVANDPLNRVDVIGTIPFGPYSGPQQNHVPIALNDLQPRTPDGELKYPSHTFHGLTKATWTVHVTSMLTEDSTYLISVTSFLDVTIEMNPDVDQFRLDRTGRSVLAHERHHEEISQNWYNKWRSEYGEKYDGAVLCLEECAELL